MHTGRLIPGSRLDRLRLRLLYGGPATTRELHEDLRLESVSTWISALRANGVGVRCEYLGLSQDRRKVYSYSLESET